MRFSHFVMPSFVLGAALLSGSVAQAQTVISGHNDNQSKAGYSIFGGDYLVVDGATFNNNGTNGMVANADTSAINLVIQGGDFEGNRICGFSAMNPGQNPENIIVSGGTFANNNEYGFYNVTGRSLTITGGTFMQDLGTIGQTALELAGNGPASLVQIEGGVFGGTAVNIDSLGSATLVGYFPSAPLGISVDTKDSSIYGRLEFAAAPQTFTINGPFTINNLGTTLPEPSALAMLGLGAAGLVRRTRR